MEKVKKWRITITLANQRVTMSSEPRSKSRHTQASVRLYLGLLLSSLAVLVASPTKASALDIGLMSGDSSWQEPSQWNVMWHSGATVFRAHISAHQYENPETWSQIEQMFRYAAERNIVILPYLYGRPENGSQQFPTAAEWTPQGNKWETFIYGIVKTFGHNGSFWSENPTLPYRPVSTWEIWNEPNLPANNPGGSTVQPQNYARFMRRSAMAVRDAQDDISGTPALVLMGGLYSKVGAGGMSVGDFLSKAKEVEQKEGLEIGSAFNGLSLHPYSFTSGRSGVESHVNNARSELTAKFGNKSLWITELGWNVKPWGTASHPAVDESQQAQYLTETFNWVKSVASQKNIPLLVWYFHRDNPVSEAWDHHAGLRRADGTYRSSWYAFQQQTGVTEWPGNPYTWHVESLGGVSTSDPDALSSGPNHLGVYARGSDGALWSRSWNGIKWNSWASLGASVSGGPGAVWGGGLQNVSSRIANGSVQTWWWNNGWSSFNLGGLNTSDPDMSAWGTTRMDMFARGSDNALWRRSWNSGTWGGWQSLGGTLASGPAAVSWGPNRIDVVALNNDANKTLSHRWYDGTSWHCCTNLGGVNTSDPDITATAPGHLVVAVRGSDNALWIRQFDVSTGWQGWEKIGGVLSSGPSAVSWQSNYRLDLFARASDNSLLHWWWGPSP